MPYFGAPPLPPIYPGDIQHSTSGARIIGSNVGINGRYQELAYTSNPNGNAVAVRDVAGRLSVNDAVAPLEATTLQQQTAAIAAAVIAAGNTDLSGSGMPNGVVAAPVGVRYTDTAATNGAVQWVKTSGTGNTGWRVLYGDTQIVVPNKVAGATGTTTFRRVGNMVYAYGNVSGFPDGQGSSSFADVPAGYQGAGGLYSPFRASANLDLVLIYVTSVGMSYSGTWVAARSGVQFAFSWAANATEIWPTV